MNPQPTTVCAPHRPEISCPTCDLVGRGSWAANVRGVCSGRVPSRRTLHREGDPFLFVHAVRVGTFKSTVSLADGREQVCGFHLPGEFVTMDGGWDGLHQTTVTALEDSQTCAIPYAALLGVAAGMPTLQQLLYRSMGRELSRGRRHMLVLGSMSSGERVAAFLLDMSQRSLARGYSKNEFVLRMSRAEIGSYLGVSLETVSRVLSGFKRERYLDVDNRVIRINDLEGFTRAFESQVP